VAASCAPSPRRPYTNALRYTQAFHDSRVYPQGVRSPQTPVQRAQVRRLLASQSAGSASSPASVVPAAARGVGPVRAPVSSSVGLGAGVGGVASKPLGGVAVGSGSILAGGPAPIARPAASAAVGERVTPPSPLRGRTSATGAAGVSASVGSAGVGRYGSRVGESPMRGGASSADRLASDLARLQGPSAGVGVARQGTNAALPYVLAGGRAKLR
jgi:hypothetical protein